MSARSGKIFVFDDGPLSHFAEAGWLGLLELFIDGGRGWMPDTVEAEVSSGLTAHAHLRQILDAPWLQIRTVGDAEIIPFGFYHGRLVGSSPRNVGECGVLALAEVHGAVAVIDDGAARKLAKERGVEVKTSVSLLCDLVNESHLSLDAASAVADKLLSTDYRLPFGDGGFKSFVIENGIVDPYA